MPRMPTETILEFTMRQIRDEILKEAEKAARGNAPENEPGEYWKGRRDAADILRAMQSNG